MPVMSEGIRSGVNCMRLNDRCSTSLIGADEQRLGQAGHADEQAVAAAEHGHEQLLDDLVLADDDLADLLGHLVADAYELPGDAGVALGRGSIRFGHGWILAGGPVGRHSFPF